MPTRELALAGKRVHTDQVMPTKLIKIAVLVLFVAIVAAIAIPGLLRAKIGANEGSAILFLRRLARAQEEFRRTGYVDQDGDGQGEYGLLPELSGAVVARGGSTKAHSPFDGLESTSDNRIFERDGYYFMLYLPTQTGVLLPQSGPMTSRRDNANAQELRYVIYAWPEEVG